ncbi:MAG TPA: hypothetical protein VFN85_03290 [Solirubrobacterales bacterium]|nr:hypothetical protein [Solirubrobacterales bacterium]
MTRPRLFVIALTLCGLLAAAPAAMAAPGELDPSFGSGGVVKLFPSKEEYLFKGVAAQADGKVVIAGGVAPGNVMVVRLLENGALDPTFGEGGIVNTPVPGGLGVARAIAIQPDGKIVVAGEGEVGATDGFLFVRYDPNGVPDPSFGGGDGIELVTIPFESSRAEDVTIGSDGRIVATGEGISSGGEAAPVVVLKQDGTPDPSFGGGNGWTLLETGAGFDTGEGVVLLPDGRVLVADASGAGGGEGFTLLRLEANASPDLSFGGGDGIAETPIPAEGEAGAGGRVNSFALMADGRIVAGGYGPNDLAVVRYLPDGELDESFAKGGIFTHQLEGEDEQVKAVELGAGEKTILAAEYEASGENAPAALRLDPNGALDPGFGSGGVFLRGQTAPFGETVSDGALDPQERLLTVGTSFEGNEITDITVTRYLGDPRAPVVGPPGPGPGPGPRNQPPHAKMKAVPKKLPVGKPTGFSGTASDPDGNGVQSVQIALVKRARGGVKAKASAGARLHCFALNGKLRFKRTKATGNQCPRVWLTAKGTSKWSFKLKGTLPPGKYVVFARAIDGKDLAESNFSRKLGNRYGFRVVASNPR